MTAAPVELAGADAEAAVRRSAGAHPARPFGVYVHVPFCASRCGYCDFNTYTAGELGDSSAQDDWLSAALRETELAAELTAGAGRPPEAQTVFFGGGTPSLVGAEALTRLLGAVDQAFALAPGAEVTVECNPESTSPEFFERLRAGGFTRISLGMQSTAPHVLAVLDRRHTPGRALAAVGEARAAGFEHVSLDVIYGSPGERDDDLRRTLDDVVATGVDHVSAYSLLVEPGTALARRVRRGELVPSADDTLAQRYDLVAEHLAAHGFAWYEVSNFARTDADRCRHNLGYWGGGQWWGIGPGAHSDVGAVRWWNVKHPSRYAAALATGGALPVAGAEELTAADRHVERIMLGLRLAEGLPAETFAPAELERARGFVARGVLRERPDGSIALTDRGRLLADGVVADLVR